MSGKAWSDSVLEVEPASLIPWVGKCHNVPSHFFVMHSRPGHVVQAPGEGLHQPLKKDVWMDGHAFQASHVAILCIVAHCKLPQHTGSASPLLVPYTVGMPTLSPEGS